MTTEKGRFVLPAAISLGIFSLLLFGFRRPAPPLALKPSDAAVILPETVAITLPDVPSESDVQTGNSDPKPSVSTSPDVSPSIDPRENSLVPSIAPAAITPTSMLLPSASYDPTEHTGPGVRPVTSAMLDGAPRARSQLPPDYPYAARQEGKSGQVVVSFWVDVKGFVHDPRIVSATDSAFAESALRGVSHWRFEPGRRNGQIVPFQMTVPVVFSVGE